MTYCPDHIKIAKTLLEKQAEINQLRAERDELRAKLEALTGNVRQTEWGSGKDESYVKVCGAPSDAYDYARAYGESVFKRKLYAGPWQPDDEDDDD